MIRRCRGWIEPKHPPMILGEIEPLDDKRFTDTACKSCWLEHTALAKSTQQVRLTAYLRQGRVLSSIYDRLGAAMRLRFARKLKDFVGYKLEAA